jgi:hypothetical protein
MKKIIIAFSILITLAFLFSKHFPTTNNHKPQNILTNQAAENKNGNNNSTSVHKTEQKLNNNADGKNCDKELKLLAKLKVMQEFDEYTEQLDDYFYIDKLTIDQMMSEIQTKNKKIVTDNQLTELWDYLKKDILAYKQGEADAIVNNLLKAPYKIKPEATAWHLTLLKTQYLETSGESLPDDPKEIMRLLVNRNYGGKNGSGYKDIYNELSVKGSDIEFHEAFQMPESIHGRLFRLLDVKAFAFKNGYVTLTPSVEYLNNPAKILKEQGKLIYADIRIAASNAQNIKYSRLKRYYWSENDKTWLPMEFIILPPSGSRFEFF